VSCWLIHLHNITCTYLLQNTRVQKELFKLAWQLINSSLQNSLLGVIWKSLTMVHELGDGCYKVNSLLTAIYRHDVLTRYTRCIKRVDIFTSFSHIFLLKRLLQIQLYRQNNLSCHDGFCPRVPVYKNR